MATPQILRDYQLHAVEAVERAWLSGKRPLTFMATGAGKTTVISELLRRNLNPQQDRALVFVHRAEIVQQIFERIQNQFAELTENYFQPGGIVPGIGIVMANERAEGARIVVASAQSLHPKRLLEVLSHGAFKILIIDEGHHYAPGNSYDKIIQTLQEHNPDLQILGVTATPKRHDKKALGHVFTEICYQWSIQNGIEGGYLTPVQRIAVQTQVNVSEVKTSKGDYEQGKLVSILKASNWAELAVQAYQLYIQTDDRLTLAFFPGVEMSKTFVAAAQEAGCAAVHLDGTTPKEERERIIAAFRAGTYRLLSNVGVLTEGFDCPETSAILMARPTRSEGLFTQIVGRGLRPDPESGKKDCLIVDLTVRDTKALNVGSLLGKLYRCKHCRCEYHYGLPACPQCGAVPEKKEQLEEEEPTGVVPEVRYEGVGSGFSDQIVSIFAHLTAAWHRDEMNWLSCSLGKDGGSFVIAPPTYASNVVRLHERLSAGTYVLKHTDPALPLFARIQADIARLERELERIDHWTLYHVSPQNQAAFGRRAIKQLQGDENLTKLLARADTEAINRGESKSGISKNSDWRVGFASINQIRFLQRLKISFDQNTLTKGQASELIDHALAVPVVMDWVAADLLPEPKKYLEQQAAFAQAQVQVSP